VASEFTDETKLTYMGKNITKQILLKMERAFSIADAW
jgi:hypothetical protein